MGVELKKVPVKVTEVPIGPLVGLIEVMVGAAILVTVKVYILTVVPSCAVTFMFITFSPRFNGNADELTPLAKAV